MNNREKNIARENSRKRKNKITIRLSDEEFNALNKKIGSASGGTKSRQQIIIELIFKGTVVTKSKDEIEALVEKERAIRATERQLAGLGNNVNQIAKKVNEGKLNALSAGGIKKELSQILSALEEIKNGCNEMRKC